MTTAQDVVAAVAADLAASASKLTASAGSLVAVGNALSGLAGALTADAAALAAIDWTAPPPPPPSTIGSGYNTTDADTSIDDLPGVSSWRGKPENAYLVLEWGHLSWQKFTDAYTKPGWPPYRQVPLLAAQGILPILRIPFLVVGGNDLDASLRGDYDHYHQACAAWIAAQPWTTDVIVSGNKEADQQGLPYYYGDTAAQRGKWWQATARTANIYTDAIEAKHPGRSRFAFCVTKRTPEPEWQSAIPDLSLLKSRLIKAPDIYLNKPGVDTAASFQDSVLRFAEPKIEWADKVGAEFGIPEWAVTQDEQPNNVQRWLDYLYGMDPKFVRFEHYYGTGPKHALYGTTALPKSAAAYAEWMKGH